MKENEIMKNIKMIKIFLWAAVVHYTLANKCIKNEPELDDELRYIGGNIQSEQFRYPSDCTQMCALQNTSISGILNNTICYCSDQIPTYSNCKSRILVLNR